MLNWREKKEEKKGFSLQMKSCFEKKNHSHLLLANENAERMPNIVRKKIHQLVLSSQKVWTTKGNIQGYKFTTLYFMSNMA